MGERIGLTAIGTALVVVAGLLFAVGYSAGTAVGGLMCSLAAFPATLGAVLLIALYTGDPDDGEDD